MWQRALAGVVYATQLSVDGVAVTGVVVVLFLPDGEVSVSEVPMFPIRRRREEVAKGGPAIPPLCIGERMGLWSFLACTRWEDDTSRALGSLTLFAEGGRVKVAFNDRDSGEVGFATLDNDEPLLDQLDQLLLEDRIDWRKQGSRGRGRG